MIFLASPALTHPNSRPLLLNTLFPICMQEVVIIFAYFYLPSALTSGVSIMSRPLDICENNPIHTFFSTLLGFSGWSNNKIDMTQISRRKTSSSLIMGIFPIHEVDPRKLSNPLQWQKPLP